ncbi:hypothetical protein BRAS3843_2490010 [Bradyrhizobium sp. STM 3843]|nr:hypothetical protein BRAS3843_2490010 [Bradyrhizobium sp. STM 3843]
MWLIGITGPFMSSIPTLGAIPTF